MFLKIIHTSENRRVKNILQRLGLDFPPIQRLKELSEGSPETLPVRSQEFGTMLNRLWINGVGKFTSPGRLALLDQWTISVMPQTSRGLLSVLDVGGSDGSTANDLVQYMENKIGGEIKAVVLDSQLKLYCFRRGLVRYFLNNSRIPFLFQVGPFGVLLEENNGKLGFILNPIIRLAKTSLKRLRPERYLKNDGEIPLKNPLLKDKSNINWIEQDLFEVNESLTGAFDLIRCCNILNFCYFSEAQLCNAVQILTRYLKPNGLLLVSRSLDSDTSMHMASLWFKEENRIIHLSDLNGGSEIKEIVQKHFGND